MKFDDYEKRYAALYAELAATVKFILEKAISQAADSPRPQSIQSRAKDPISLERKLRSRELLDSSEIENEIKDLAGVRLIFYTNTDVDRFLNTRLIPSNFAVDYSATKIHYPVKENEGLRYQAFHQVATLSDERLALAEYAKFKDMRCEIQIQTVLDHAWAETSHDILYKNDATSGFGSMANAAIKRRFEQIMDKYLLPAGYEFQRVQHDYERLRLGKALFDRDALKALREAENNNERHDLLVTFKEHVLPNYDDLSAVYHDVSNVLVEVAKSARATPARSIKTVFGSFDGKSTEDVLRAIIDIFSMLRYVDVERTFFALCDLYESESESEVRKRILDATTVLAQHEFHVWTKVGLHVQRLLIETIERLPSQRYAALRPLLIAVWSEALGSEIKGTSWSAETVTFKRSAVAASPQLETTREKALLSLFDAFAQSTSHSQRREVWTAFRRATHVPTSIEYSNELLAMSLSDSKRIVDFMAEQTVRLPFQEQQHIEHEFLWDYRHARPLADDRSDRRGVRILAQSLMSSIETLRTVINSSEKFVRHKVLIGFEGVFPPAWGDDNFDIEGVDKYRQERIQEYVAAISTTNEEEWREFIELCAATKSDDLATFPVFSQFLRKLAEAQPTIATRLIDQASDDLLNFLPAILDGLKASTSPEAYNNTITHFLNTESRLAELAFHLRMAGQVDDTVVASLLEKAISISEATAVTQCLVLVVERGKQASETLVKKVFVPAIKYLLEARDARWHRIAWQPKQGELFFAERTKEQIELTLKSLLTIPRLEYQAERVLGWMAKVDLAAVWAFFGDRLRDSLDSDGLHHEAIPFRFHGLEKILSRDANLGVSLVREWYRTDSKLFRYRGGRLLKAVFTPPSEQFVQTLTKLAAEETNEGFEFIIGILSNFEGETVLHPIFQELVCQLSEDEELLTEIDVVLQQTGVVAGPFGFVEAYRQKKDEIAPWLNDSRPQVAAYAARYIGKLDQRIAAEQRSAEQRQEQRKRDFESDDDE